MDASLTAAEPLPYMIPVGKQDENRLDALGAIFDEGSMQWMQESGVQSDARFLNVGCGNGGFTLKFAQDKPDSFCVGIDISPEQIAVAKQRADARGLKNTEWKTCDVYHMAELQETYPKLFDVVRSRFVLSHLKEPKKAINEMLSMVKPGGVLILEESNSELQPVVHPKRSKAIDAWIKMVQFQAQMQQSHPNTAELALEYLVGRVSDLSHDVRDIPIEGQLKKSMFRMFAEHSVKKIEEMGKPVKKSMFRMFAEHSGKKIEEMSKPELIERLGYDDPQTWIKDMYAFENDDSQTMTVKNFSYIRATKE